MAQANLKIPVAICYDFDGTLAPGNMQEHSYIQDLGLSITNFWEEANKLARENDMNEILAYMHLMLEKARQKNFSIKKCNFKEYGKNIPLLPGVDEWFMRTNAYGKALGLDINHFIISSGLREMIEGTSIAGNFSCIFASGYYYDNNGIAVWPATGIDYTAKTQFLFRINKGIFNSWDNAKINKFTPENERPFPFSRIIYVGDGETDIPAMKMLNYKGGYSIAVYDPHKRTTKMRKSPKEICLDLLKHRRAKFISPADYRENGELDKLIVNIFNDIHYKHLLEKHNHKYSPQSTTDQMIFPD